MRMPPFELHLPESLDSAMAIAGELADEDCDFDWIAGGTDLLPNYKWHLNSKPHVISLAKVSELSTLEPTHIGAMVRLHALATSDSSHPLLRQTAGTIASVMIRRSGTVGGNICLDTRCFWFNQGEEWRRSIDWCIKCDCGTGADCRVISHQNELCVATYQADLAAPLLALDATIHLSSPDGSRSLPLAEFFQEDGITRNVLKDGEMVTHLTLPADAEDWQGDYQKLRLRESWDFPEAGIAAAWRIDEDGNLGGLRVASTALESIPRLHQELADEAREGWAGVESVNALAVAVQKAVKPVNNTWFPPSYRKKMVRVLTRRALAPLERVEAAN
jgi:4-hydroxybenzoyl-CoA reductase subunit beta